MDLATVEEIVPAERSAIDGFTAGDAWLAGGTWLFSEPQPRLRRLIDLAAFGWPSLAVTEAGLEVAATCTLAELAAWRDYSGRWPAAALIGECCRALLGSFKVWNAATVGGNLCLALPAGPMISLAVALDGAIEIWELGGATSSVPAAGFVTGAGDTILDRGALLRSLTLPAHVLGGRTAFRQFSLSPLGRSAAVLIGRADPASGEFVLSITAAVPRPAVLRFASAPSAEELADAIDDAGLWFYDDPHGHPLWRAQLTRLLAEEVRSELAGS